LSENEIRRFDECSCFKGDGKPSDGVYNPFAYSHVMYCTAHDTRKPGIVPLALPQFPCITSDSICPSSNGNDAKHELTDSHLHAWSHMFAGSEIPLNIHNFVLTCIFSASRLKTLSLGINHSLPHGWRGSLSFANVAAVRYLSTYLT
jgi:hypothetical protein